MKKIPFLILLSLLLNGNTTAQKTDYVVTIKTSFGDMVIILYDETPKHKQNFIKLAQEHYFDSLLFHRVINGFMIQGGDPNSKKAKTGTPLGNGGPGYTIEAEFNPKFYHKRGALAAARLGGPQNPLKASSGSQFYIVHGTVLPETAIGSLKFDQSKLNQAMQQFISKPENKAISDTLRILYTSGKADAFNAKVFSLVPEVEKVTGIKIINEISPDKIKDYTTIGGVPRLDNEYTVFGEVIKGLDVIDKIARLSKDQSDRPLEDVRMFVTIEQMPLEKIKNNYGYTYPQTDQKK